jgi:ankyrin repeat protein
MRLAMKTILKNPLSAAALAAFLIWSNTGCALFHHHSTYGSIHQSAKSGDAASVAAELAAHPEELNQTDDLGQTPLHIAAAQCHTNLVALLLDKGAATNPKAKGGATPLHLAAQEGCADAVTLLLAKGAEVNARDDQGRTPLTRAKQWHRDAIAEWLRQHGGVE